jgi:hypothetical protein
VIKRNTKKKRPYAAIEDRLSQSYRGFKGHAILRLMLLQPLIIIFGGAAVRMRLEKSRSYAGGNEK